MPEAAMVQRWSLFVPGPGASYITPDFPEFVSRLSAAYEPRNRFELNMLYLQVGTGDALARSFSRGVPACNWAAGSRLGGCRDCNSGSRSPQQRYGARSRRGRYAGALPRGWPNRAS